VSCPIWVFNVSPYEKFRLDPEYYPKLDRRLEVKIFQLVIHSSIAFLLGCMAQFVQSNISSEMMVPLMFSPFGVFMGYSLSKLVPGANNHLRFLATMGAIGGFLYGFFHLLFIFAIFAFVPLCVGLAIGLRRCEISYPFLRVLAGGLVGIVIGTAGCVLLMFYPYWTNLPPIFSSRSNVLPVICGGVELFFVSYFIFLFTSLKMPRRFGPKLKDQTE